MTIDHARLSEVGFAHQVERLRRRLATPSTQSACPAQPRLSWVRRAPRPVPNAKPPINAVLTVAEVLEIHHWLSLGIAIARIARRYQVDRRTIRDIKNGVTWTRLWPPTTHTGERTL